MDLYRKWSESRPVVSDSLRPHGLYSPWNSPGQDTGVGSQFPSPADLPNPGIEPRSPTLQADSLPAEPPGKPKNTEVGSLSLLQQIFPTQESNQGPLHCRRILYQLSHQGRPRILDWVAIPFSSRSSKPRDWTQVSCIAGGFFTSWATREAQEYWSGLPCPPSGDCHELGIEPGSPALQADSLPAEPPGKPKNTGVGSLSLLQRIFPTQESNQGLLHHRWILYHQSHLDLDC